MRRTSAGGLGLAGGSWTRACGLAHGKDWTFNRAFVDGHGDVQKIYMEGTEDQNGYALHYRCEEGVISDDQDCTTHPWRCIIVRGDGWQKDTLPADQIPTRLMHGGAGRPSYEGCVD